MLFGNLARHHNLLFPTMLPCFSILIPSRNQPCLTLKKKKIQEGQQKFIKLKNDFEKWKTIQKASKRVKNAHHGLGATGPCSLKEEKILSKFNLTAAKQHLFYLKRWQLEFLCNSVSSLELPRLHPSCWAHLWRTLFSSLRAHFVVGSTGVEFSFKTWVA